MTRGVGIIAGGGDLPKIIATALKAQGVPYLVVSFAGQDLVWTAEHSSFTAEFERPEALFEALRRAECSDVVMAGAMARPHLSPERFDPTFAAIVPRLMTALQQGDDAGLSVVISMFEDAGFSVRAAHEVCPELTVPAGVLTKSAPEPGDEADAARAETLVASIGQLDVGQGAVVANGLCLGLETLQGTEAMLAFVKSTDPKIRAGGGGVFYKAPKPAQDHRVDLPAIGRDTIAQAHGAGLNGIVIAAGHVLLIDKAALIEDANRLGLFIWSRAVTE